MAAKEESIEVIVARIDENLKEALRKLPDHERRIRWVERAVLVLIVASGGLVFDRAKDVLSALGG